MTIDAPLELGDPPKFACGPRDVMVARIKNYYGEVRMYVGEDAHRRPVELWFNRKDGTFSLVLFPIPAVACLMGVVKLERAKKADM